MIRWKTMSEQQRKKSERLFWLIDSLLLMFLFSIASSLPAADFPGTATGTTTTWDFTASAAPEGGKLRKGARLQEGLVPSTVDISVAGGFQLNSAKSFVVPEAFLFEAEFVPGWKPAEDVQADDKVKTPPKNGVLWDNLYVTYATKKKDSNYHHGFQVMLTDCGNDKWQAKLYIGYGDSTEGLTGPTVKVEPGKSVRLAFLYDANRSVRWNFNGQQALGVTSIPGAIAKSNYAPVIGDRVGSNYNAFPGTIRRVSITPYQREPIAISPSGRLAFLRGEKDAVIKVEIGNYSSENLRDLQVTVEQGGTPVEKGTLTTFTKDSIISRFQKTFTALASQKTGSLDYPVETRLMPGWYPVKIKAKGKNDQGDFTVEYQFNLGIGPVFADRMTTLMWMYNNRPATELRAFGFTHGLTGFGFSHPEEVPGPINSGLTSLDDALVNGFRLVKGVNVYPPAGKPADDYMRTGRDGKVVISGKKPQLEVSHPEVQEYARATAELNARIFGTHPAWGGVLPNSEMRDNVFPSFRSEPSQYRTATGKDIPTEVTGKVPGRAIGPKRFPDGRVPDNDELLNYYSWFWNGGDGWPTINTAIAREYRKVAVKPFFSFFDPAVRTPPKWGSGGEVDVLSQWVYAVPEPLAVAGPADELEAMAAGTGQQVMIMTQIICYRAQIAPKNVKVDPLPQWVIDKPDADFPTIPPDSIQEATWAMIAKPVKGIMYHGYACIVELGAKTGYTFTNAETGKRLTHLLNNVVAPLGPTLKRLPRPQSEVAVLESFASTLFNGHGSWGWITPDLLFLQRARLDPRVIYEETILRDGFGNAKVLYMSLCDYLPESVLQKILEFQKNGGIVIGDEFLNKTIKADIVIDHNDVVRTNVAEAKEQTLAKVESFRKKLDSRFKSRVDSTSPELITFLRQWNGVDYLFVINDKRTYGDYVGQWKQTMEKGLPFEGAATLADPKRKIQAVYELSRGGEVPFNRQSDGTIQVPLKYETNDGRLLLFLKKSVAKVTLAVPEKVRRGEKCQADFRVLDRSGKSIAALLPVEVRLFDSNGTEIDGGGYICAENGGCTLEFQTNINGPKGKYKVTGKDRASGQTVEKTVTVD